MRYITSLFACLFILSVGTASAQSKHKLDRKPHHPRVEEVVKDLNSGQKRKIDQYCKERGEHISALEGERETLRDSIRTVLHKEGDNSKVLFRMLDREAKIQAEIGKEMYRTRLKIDAVLTPDQVKLMRQQEPTQKKERHPNRPAPKK